VDAARRLGRAGQLTDAGHDGFHIPRLRRAQRARVDRRAQEGQEPLARVPARPGAGALPAGPVTGGSLRARAGILAGYTEVAPLAAGWRERVPLHQLHPLLVHACLFGAGYSGPVAEAARAALAA